MGPSMGTSAEKPRVKVARVYRIQGRYWVRDLSRAALEWRDPGRQRCRLASGRSDAQLSSVYQRSAYDTPDAHVGA
jgi:hypothetical protein